jgi:hypothetical protein
MDDRGDAGDGEIDAEKDEVPLEAEDLDGREQQRQDEDRAEEGPEKKRNGIKPEGPRAPAGGVKVIAKRRSRAGVSV